ncbi:UDP-N-acetylglucosamine--N-acetylmuramyl-(pentapeptide) pyrophosphoryl-undecaprenol N-acetylglucosamine transferase [Campylobacterota bacterium]|nr:UDP-N-acetylglucosamine--N-acetylmuramyl-(pentapeptide) pyrophosphoryl-undecaprenol N-acetylglucosamine transferase [Campylobacterota bacterium]
MIAITGGGTGGHLAIVRSVKNALVQSGVKPIYIGSTAGLDRAWFENDDGFLERFFLPSGSVMNRGFFGKIVAVFNILRLVFRACKILRSRRVTALLSVGGYSAAPAAFAAIALRIPLIIHEQNAVRGSLNRLLAPFAKSFYSAFEPTFLDYPVAQEYFDRARIRRRLKTVIFLGGSQGARAINDYALLVAPILAKNRVRIIHQTGERDYERVSNFYRDHEIEANCFAFTDRLIDFVSRADLAVARSGASTLFELTANGLPALFVPYPHAARQHQLHNAHFLSQRDLAWCVNERHLTVEILEALLHSSLEEMSVELPKAIAPDGAKTLATALLSA